MRLLYFAAVLLAPASEGLLFHIARTRCHPGGLDSFMSGRRSDVKHASSFDVGVAVWHPFGQGAGMTPTGHHLRLAPDDAAPLSWWSA